VVDPKQAKQWPKRQGLNQHRHVQIVEASTSLEFTKISERFAPMRNTFDVKRLDFFEKISSCLTSTFFQTW
jgi:hypothetical protein